jgi:hypothetical protein
MGVRLNQFWISMSVIELRHGLGGFDARGYHAFIEKPGRGHSKAVSDLFKPGIFSNVCG